MPTLLEKIWSAHVVGSHPSGHPLLFADRHLVHEVTSPQAFSGLREAGRKVRRPELTFAVMDHVTPTDVGRGRPLADSIAEAQLAAIERNCDEFGIRLLNMDDPRQGVIHVALPELGFVLPGQTAFCGDSHTATHGAFGALAFGVGTSEVEHVLATQCLPQAMPKNMAVTVNGELGPGVGAKDLVLYIIGTLGFGGGTGYVIEYRGPVIEKLSMEERMTLCNMSVECGAKAGLVAPDQTTFDYLEGRPLAPAGADFAAAVEFWKTLPSDADAVYDREVVIDAADIKPQVTWGTNPSQVSAVTSRAPDPSSIPDPDERAEVMKALAYMGIKHGQPLTDLAVDVVFIGSCTNGRLSDLEAAAAVAKGRKVAAGVRALVVPGSGGVKAQAEAMGLDQIFIEAGFEWREPGCSMCLAMNPDHLEPGQRSASTSNRNFQDRQGRGGRTHLVSPAMAAAAAVTGRITDLREME